MGSALSSQIMALPITGPFSKSTFEYATLWDGSQTKISNRRQQWYRQAKPYDRPLIYHSVEGGVTGISSCSKIQTYDFSSSRGYTYANSANWSNPHIAAAYNKAYSKLLSKVKEDTAEMGANMVEFRKTAAMVEDRSVQLFQAFRALRRGRFGEANALLRVPPSFRPKAKKLGGVTLEYSFGWAPVVADIQSGMKILTGGVPPARVVARVTTQVPTYREFEVNTLHNARYCEIKNLSVSVTAGAVIKLTNPNLWLANQMGFVNPFAVLWETFPFSFIVDYFVNIGDVVNSWSDFMGIDVVYPYRSFVLNVTAEEYDEYGEDFDKSSPCYPHAWRTLRSRGFRMGRELNLPGPTLRLAPPNVSIRRAVTSIALLLQLLKGK